ncbi:PucR family transcriptional regulator [Arthrobacter sp. 9V]|uniref:PucR family transcriptional regulator n=1 Tax=Arthrobacter sp. 9V TaxID=2653132 RepID=UPI0012F1CF23|nr:helix-turn-helix domain-containing protein [Arthrobacter sp. 9V]VXB50622.1 PucR family transcriptional regulator [Arthrobacter sp. 9V]
MSNQHPRISLGRVLDDLGATLLELVAGDVGRPDEIGGVVIHDPFDEPVLPPNALVLGIGLQDAECIAPLLTRLGLQGALGLVVRAPVAADLRIANAVRESGVTLLGLTPGAAWAQLAAMLRTLMAAREAGAASTDSMGGLPSGDLFSLANAIAALMDAPVVIEDRSSRVLAFSGRQDEADHSRVETILGRQVPEAVSKIFVERGVFRELYRSNEPVTVEALPPNLDAISLPRVAVAVRAGDEVLGSIWVAVRRPLGEERMQSLRDSAKLVALHLLRLRTGADVERRMRADLLSKALEGGLGAQDALDRLGLAEQPLVVLALAVLQNPGRHVEGDAGLAMERQRISDSFAMHLGAVQPRAAVALLGDTTYALLPVSQDDQGEERAAATGGDFLRRLGDRANAAIGVGSLAKGATELPAARTSADRVLRVLRTGDGKGQRVARLADVHVEALILELSDLAASRGEQPTGQIARLYAYDEKHNANLVDTLRAWLDAFGDVAVASAAVYIHPNTFRYRLRRLSLVGGLDLDDPKTRFAAMLQLCILSSRS